MITIEIKMTPAAADLVKRAGQLTPAAMEGMRAALDQQNALSTGWVQEKYLSFPRNQKPTREGLRVITNKLRGSVRWSAAKISGTVVSGSFGTNVKYAALHEFGGTVQRKARVGRVAGGDLFKTSVGLKTRIAARRLGLEIGKGKRARVASGYGKIGAHAANYPARRMFQRTIADRMGEYEKALSAAVVEGMGKALE